MSAQTPVTEFYRGRAVFITGATGFMGKVLVEKLLRCCPDVGTIYLLMRPKKGQGIRSRLNEMISAKIFDWANKDQNGLLSKLVPISGDVTVPQLGLSEEDRKTLIDNVSVVFHTAASVKFDEPLKHSVLMNLSGTKKLLDLCLQMNKLEALVHVSTAYSNCNKTVVEEKIYPPPSDPEKIMQTVDILDEAMLDSITPKILNDLPNTYVFTKALAEHLLMEQGGRLPIAIVRPSIVTASWKEPIPGWVSNLNGPTGLFAGAGKGVLRSILCNGDYIADLIPVDFPINMMLAVAWHTATFRPNNIMVYHCTSGTTNPIHWGEVEVLLSRSIQKYPFNEIVWYPGGSFKKSKLLNQICMTAFHTVPAHLFDTIFRMTGKRPIMVKLQQKLQRATKYLEFFTTNEFKFLSENTKYLWNQLQPEDQKMFNFDVGSLNWTEYIDTYIYGIRKFIMKEDSSTITTARNNMKKMYLMHRFTQVALMAVMWRLLMFRSEMVHRTWHSMFTFMLRMMKSVSNFSR